MHNFKHCEAFEARVELPRVFVLNTRSLDEFLPVHENNKRYVEMEVLTWGKHATHSLTDHPLPLLCGPCTAARESMAYIVLLSHLLIA